MRCLLRKLNHRAPQCSCTCVSIGDLNDRRVLVANLHAPYPSRQEKSSPGTPASSSYPREQTQPSSSGLDCGRACNRSGGPSRCRHEEDHARVVVVERPLVPETQRCSLEHQPPLNVDLLLRLVEPLLVANFLDRGRPLLSRRNSHGHSQSGDGPDDGSQTDQPCDLLSELHFHVNLPLPTWRPQLATVASLAWPACQLPPRRSEARTPQPLAPVV